MQLWNRGVRWFWIALGAGCMALTLAVVDRAKAPAPGFSEWEADWGRRFPREYESWRQAREPADSGHGPGRTKWGGRDRREPRALFAGYAFAEADTPATARHPVACGTCHDPATLDLRLTQPAFLAALAERGVDPARLPREELGSYVCAQCHAARFLDWEAGRARLPFTAEGLVALSEQSPLADWRHAESGTSLLKLRSPEFELWTMGAHAHKGVTCVDCHMPARREGTLWITSHRLQSPLLDVLASCVPCHHWGEAKLLERAEAIQDATMTLMRRASTALLAAHAALGEARKAGLPEARLAPARALLRQAQTHWDFIASERSTGFHAPQEAAEQLGIALDQARQAELLARRLRAPEAAAGP